MQKYFVWASKWSTQLEISGYVTFTTVLEQYNANIWVCGADFFTEDYFLNLEESSYNVNTMNGCEQYKVGQFQCRMDSLVLLIM